MKLIKRSKHSKSNPSPNKGKENSKDDKRGTKKPVKEGQKLTREVIEEKSLTTRAKNSMKRINHAVVVPEAILKKGEVAAKTPPAQKGAPGAPVPPQVSAQPAPTIEEDPPTAPMNVTQDTSREVPAVKLVGSTEKIKPSPEQNKAPAAANPDKWAAELTAKAWLDAADFGKVKNEYGNLQKMTVDIEKDCKKWKAHPKLNQSEDYPALDANLAKCPDANDYVNISQVTVPLRRCVYLGQIPMLGAEETFWKAFFELRITSMHILNEDVVGFFPPRNGDFRHYGTMFVNNRRVENIGEDVLRYAIEVLPAGMSNSIIATVTVIKNWNMDSVHPKQAVVMKEVLEMSTFLANALPDENALIISKNGAGRAGYFLALAVAVNKLDQKMEPNIAEIVKSIRVQRPKAVDTVTQYASLYIALFYYIKKKMTKPGEPGKPGSADSVDPLCKKSVQLTQLFATALMAEMAANAGKSVMFVNPK